MDSQPAGERTGDPLGRTPAPVPESAKAWVRLELICRLPDGVGPLCEFVRDRWLPSMYPGATGRKTAMMAYDGPKDVKVQNTATKVGSNAFAAAIARVDNAPRGGGLLSLISWITGRPFGYGPSGGDEIWVTMARDVDPAEDEYRVYAICPRDKAPLLVGLAVEVCSEFEVLAGGAWSPGGFWPSWANYRWKMRANVAPTVAGPMWLVVAPVEADQLLARSDGAVQMAIDRHPYPGGAVWQLCAEIDGPLGDDLDNWQAMMHDLGLWHPWQ